MAKTFEPKRGYYEVNYLLRAARVDRELRGYKLLQIAIMTYLNNPKLTLEELVEISKKNSPMYLESEEQCFKEMKGALHSVCTTHTDKLEADNAVFKFIDNISTEVRVGELVRIHMMDKDICVEQQIVEMLLRVCIRRKMKSQDSFSAILNHTAGRCGYDEVEDFVDDLYKVVGNEKEIGFKEKTKRLKAFIDECLAKKDEMEF